MKVISKIDRNLLSGAIILNTMENILRTIEKFENKVLLLALFSIMLSSENQTLAPDIMPTLSKETFDDLYESVIHKPVISNGKFI